jgi:hypothetical protein
VSSLVTDNARKTLEIILMITEKHDATNYITGIYRHLGSKQIASNAKVQAKPKP